MWLWLFEVSISLRDIRSRCMVSNIVYTTKKTTITRFIYTLVQSFVILHNFHHVCYFACVNNTCDSFAIDQVVSLLSYDMIICWALSHKRL